MITYPIETTETTVTLRRADYETLCALARASERNQDEDDDDDAADAIAAEAVLADIAAGRTECEPIWVYERLRAGEVPVRVFREWRGLSARDLAALSGVDPGYLSQIETGKKPGSATALRKLAAALRVDMEDLLQPPAATGMSRPALESH